MSKLLLLGLDGGDINYIRSRASVLPCFASKLKSDRLLILDTPKALSGSVWPTFYNGVNPAVHGVYQHLVWDAQNMAIRLIGNDWCYNRPFWQEIEDKLNKKAMVLDIPYSFANTLNQGVQIIDWASHGQTFPTNCNCPQAQAILKKIGKSPIKRETPIEKNPHQLQKIEQSILKSAQLKGKLIQELATKIDYDLFIAVFAETHRGGHAFFGDEDEQDFNGNITPNLRIYQAVDRAIAEIIANVDDDTQVVIFSVHGMARDYSQGHITRPVMKKINEVFLEKYCQIPPRPQVKANSIVPYLRKVVPSQLQYFVGANSPDFVRRWVVEKEIIGGLDWSRTPCFVLRSDIRTELRYNLIDRESQGFLEANSTLHKQYTNFCREVLFSIEDAETQEKLVDDLIDTRQEFSGQNSDRLPDLVICWQRGKPPVRSVYSPLIGRIEVKPSGARTGDHPDTDSGFIIIPPELENLSPLNKVEDFAGFCHNFFNKDISLKKSTNPSPALLPHSQPLSSQERGVRIKKNLW